jgi:signal transduction histidine kinase
VAAGAVFVVLLACDFIGAGVGMDVVGPIGAWAAAPLAIGVVVRVSREQVLQTRRDDARRRDDDARRQADEERLRVAQEVHDVVGHGLAAITMQAEIALHLMERERSRAKEAHPGRAGEPGSSGAADPASGLAAKAEPSREQEAQPSREQEAQPSREEEAQPSREEEAQPSREQEAQPSREQEAQPSYAEEALKAISRTSRESLEELRAALGAVRRGDDLDDRAPTAGLALLEALVDRTRAVGVPVAMDICGPIKGLPIVVDLTAYRIVQESLTNVLRHAGPASAAVDISVGDDEVTIEVTDDGHAAPSDGDGDGYMSPSNGESDGHGLAGMRERVTALGGSLTAGPRPEGGFAVSATLPVRR